MSTPTQTADPTIPPAVAKAQKVVDEWEAKASAARAEAAEIERGSGAAILADPSAAEKISIKVDAKQRTARAYDSAAAESLEQVRAAWRKAVEAEAKQLEKDATTMRRDADKHRAEVEKLLARLKDLDGVEYEPKFGHPSYVQSGVYHAADDAPRESKSDDLEGRAAGAETQAKYVRHILATGSTTGFPDAPSLGYIETPPITQAALDAGAL